MCVLLPRKQVFVFLYLSIFFLSTSWWTFSICVVWWWSWLLLTWVRSDRTDRRNGSRGGGVTRRGGFSLWMFVFLFPIWSARGPVLSELPFMKPVVRPPEYMTGFLSALCVCIAVCPCCCYGIWVFSKIPGRTVDPAVMTPISCIAFL